MKQLDTYHLEKMESLQKLSFILKTYFLRADEYGLCNVLIKGKTVNLGDGDGMQFSCKFNFAGRKKFICILQKTLMF